MGYYFYLPEDHNVIISHHVIFLEKKFIQDGGSGRKIELEEKIYEEHWVQKSELNSEPVDVVPPPPVDRVGSPILHLGILTEDLEKAFLMRDRDIRNDPKTYDEVMLDINFEK